MVNALRLVVLAGLAVAATTTLAAAQKAPAPDNSPVTLAVGYQLQRIGDTNRAKGAFVDLSFGRSDVEGVLQVGASSKASTFTSRHTLPGFSQTTEATMHLSRAMGGIRVQNRGDTATPFIHALGG